MEESEGPERGTMLSLRAFPLGAQAEALPSPRQEARVVPLPLWARRRPALLLLSAALVALPFLVVTFPPVTDLPQHVAQVRLLHEALGAHGAGPSPYRIQPFTPYWSVYVLLTGLWALLPPLQVGRIGVLALGLLWVGGVHALAWRRGRAAEAAVLASLPFFNHTLYWGFCSFLVGWPVFLLWLQRVSRPPARTVGTWLAHAALAALLFWSHALWFAAGGLTLAMQWALQHRGRDWRSVLLQGSAVLPTAGLALWWYPQLAERGFDSPTAWFSGFYQRLSLGWMSNATFGGLHDTIEGPLFLALLAWLGVGLWQARRELRARVDVPLLGTALLLFALVLVLPNEHSNTIRLAERWMPFSAALFLLALPAPRLRPHARAAVALGLSLLLSVATALAWHRFERRDLAGLPAALAALPEHPRVLGLDFLRTSSSVKGRPFLQTFAYAQVLRGGELAFSFADFAPSPVVYRDTGRRTWTKGLEWYAARVKPADLERFDYVLLGASPKDQDTVPGRWPSLVPVTTEGRWRLYRVVPAADAADGATP
ncbi:hypothetical protein FGE12_05540 [Aggregicoccus sp. 17bor-14]|uniref:hypothetical protein n=1 Tax=Myxococcaceae TaxID=31 RepID=UPI00129CD26C|nr:MULTISPECIES: hypothetical protein [Myxococcaceae]MBF5041845.1 hypothetical protein [Simulacricoccus sp. 17bor-14]MRI87626.1 hypothetical protein [Aggregicoccus sp. 17bor-14]